MFKRNGKHAVPADFHTDCGERAQVVVTGVKPQVRSEHHVARIGSGKLQRKVLPVCTVIFQCPRESIRDIRTFK